VDILKLDTTLHAHNYVYGIGKFFMGLDLLPPHDDLKQIIQLNSFGYCHDLRFAFSKRRSVAQKDLSVFSKGVLSQEKFKEYLTLCFGQHKQSQIHSLANFPSG